VSAKEPLAARAARRETTWLAALALGLRLAWVAFAATRFPPADDGTFYHAVATRIAAGAGYTWAWPDGAVTYAAHYPVGYPALLGGAYALFGAAPAVAMVVNALFGSALVAAVHRAALRLTSLRRARLGALALALHPTLILYTAALMTEAVAAALLALLVAFALRLGARASGEVGQASAWWRLLLGAAGAGLVLLRPLLLPLLRGLGAVAVCVSVGAARGAAFWARLRGAGEVSLVAVALCLPWTLRNCEKMDGCVFVSANGGWNLLIGTLPEGRGSFAPIAGPSVPRECREVFGEAAKDRCFGRAGGRRIAAAPGAWLGLVPQKWGQLFNHSAVASSYLHASNGALVADSTKLGIAAVETLYTRLLLLGACLGLLRHARRSGERSCALLAALFTLSPWGYLAELALLASLAAGTPSPGRRPLPLLAAAVLGLCFVTHAVFFGAARYALVWLPFLAWLLVLPGKGRVGAPPAHVGPGR
jgi:4-amino-4-deoxy-L-arabinose transferase-like glycosyltransferase